MRCWDQISFLLCIRSGWHGQEAHPLRRGWPVRKPGAEDQQPGPQHELDNFFLFTRSPLLGFPCVNPNRLASFGPKRFARFTKIGIYSRSATASLACS